MKIPIAPSPVTASYLAYGYLSLVGWTTRIIHGKRNIYHELKGGDGPFIFAFWHNRLMLPLYLFRGMNVATLVSQSKDGEYITQVMLRCGLKVSRGSASRHGAEGLLGLMHFLKKGTSVAITPDGPRGPREIAQRGIIQLARLSGLPIAPVAFGCSRYIRLNSWDRMIIPFPFGQIHYELGDLITIPRTASKEDMETKRVEFETEMKRLTALIDERHSGR